MKVNVREGEQWLEQPIPLTRVISPPTKKVVRYVPNSKPTQMLRVVNPPTLIGIPAQRDDRKKPSI